MVIIKRKEILETNYYDRIRILEIIRLYLDNLYLIGIVDITMQKKKKKRKKEKKNEKRKNTATIQNF